MTEMPKIKKKKKPSGVQPRYSVNPIAFVGALILAPIWVTLLSFWTLIGLFALPFGAIPYLVIGTPILLWAVGRIKPSFKNYAQLGLLGDVVLLVAIALFFGLQGEADTGLGYAYFLGGFGLIFAPLYAGAFGWLYSVFHPKIRVLQI